MVLEAVQMRGLAPLLGSSPTVGVVGYSLGGGLGWLARNYGLACDRVHAIELVTAEGRFLKASAEENSDLFWAMRGGGGGFGVVTALEFGLVPVSTVYGGTLLYPVELAEEVFKSYRAWTMALPEEWTTSVKLANFPPVELVPEMLRGKSFVMVNGCYCGPVEDGEAYLQDWLDWGAHIQNSFQVMPFGEVASINQDPQDPVPSMHNGAWFNQLNDEVIKTIIQFATPKDGPTPLTITEVRHVGGAMSHVNSGVNAFSLRDSKLLVEIVG
ncbi:MAG: FAD-binding protein, partial [Anaerolineales bacterium]